MSIYFGRHSCMPCGFSTFTSFHSKERLYRQHKAVTDKLHPFLLLPIFRTGGPITGAICWLHIHNVPVRYICLVFISIINKFQIHHYSCHSLSIYLPTSQP